MESTTRPSSISSRCTARADRLEAIASSMAVGVILAWGMTGCAEDLASPSSGPSVIGSVPAQGAWAVSRVPRLVLELDRPIAPRGLPFGTVNLRSGPRVYPLRIVSDPVTRTIEVVPDVILDPDASYRLVVSGITDLDGAEAPPVTLRFATSTSTAADPLPTAGWADVEPVLARCAECHIGERAPLGLDLSSPEGILATAMGVPAREVASEDPVASRSGLLGLARIEPGWPSDSFLIWKLTGDPHVPGARMPMDGALEPGQAELLVAWVRDGAPLP